ncbi:MAG: hypothetical protein AAFQ22_10355 [Pseudomonadota bacterium]
MNTERLYDLLNRIGEEVEEKNILSELKKLKKFFDQLVANPADPAQQNNIASSLDLLEEYFSQSWFSRLTPEETRTLSGMGFSELIDGQVVRYIRDQIRDNGMLPAVVRDHLQEKIVGISNNIDLSSALKTSLDHLGFEPTPLPIGVGEAGFTIPRRAISEHYREFVDDAKFFGDLAASAVELVEGKARPVRLISVASSDYSIFIELAPSTIAFLVLAIERATNFYKTTLEIRMLQQQLKSRNVSGEVVEKLEHDVNEKEEAAVRQGVEAAIAEHSISATKGRKAELVNLLSSHLKKFLSKLENDYVFDARIGTARAEAEEADENQEAEETASQADQDIRQKIAIIKSLIDQAKSFDALEHNEGPI